MAFDDLMLRNAEMPRETLDQRLARLERDRDLYIDYLNSRAADHDWHGVSDAAMDLREIEAEIRGMRALLTTFEPKQCDVDEDRGSLPNEPIQESLERRS